MQIAYAFYQKSTCTCAIRVTEMCQCLALAICDAATRDITTKTRRRKAVALVLRSLCLYLYAIGVFPIFKLSDTTDHRAIRICILVVIALGLNLLHLVPD